jgi:hypothetical protein
MWSRLCRNKGNLLRFRKVLVFYDIHEGNVNIIIDLLVS